MNNLFQRILLTIITVPVVAAGLFYPLDSHIIIVAIFGLAVTFIGSLELSSLIYSKGIKINRYFLPTVNLLLYSFAYCYANNFFSIQSNYKILTIFALILVFVVLYIYSRDVAASDLKHSSEKMAYTIFGLCYIGIPSVLFPFLLNLDMTGGSTKLFLGIQDHGTLFGSFQCIYLIVIIWVNDIFAYVFGSWLGKNNKCGLAASPNKSWAGYIGGFFTTFIFVALFYFLFKKYLDNVSFFFYFLYPILSGILVPIGDLVESVFKRSVNVKDSGHIIMGRGGILDSVDTLLFMLPVYFFSLQIYLAFNL